VQIAGETVQAIPAVIELTASRLGIPMIRRERGAGPIDYPEPVTGLLIARQLEQSAGQWARNYMRDLRQAGVSWYEISCIMGLDDAAAGFAAATVAPWMDSDANRWRSGGTFGWHCQPCGLMITDHGPVVAVETGHADGCLRSAKEDLRDNDSP
jgi:hypothetical protein